MLGYLLLCAAVTHGVFVIKRRFRIAKDVHKKQDNDHSKVYYIKLPNFAVAAVIGKRGCVLRKIMNETQTDCKVHNISHSDSSNWKFENTCDDWFENDKKSQDEKYLAVRTMNKEKLHLVKLRVAEIIEGVRNGLKTIEFPIDSTIIGYVIGKGGRRVRKLSAEFNCNIQISRPLIDNPTEAIVTISGRDLNSMEQAALIIRETKYLAEGDHIRQPAGIYEDVQKELYELNEVRRILERPC